MIIGSSGVGKSTLINSILGEYLAEEGAGKRCTAIGKRYISKNKSFITLFDSVGTEIGQGHTLEDVQRDTLDEITKNLNINDPNEHIHCIIYCTTSNRIFEDELKVILKIREKYDGKRLPIIIVYISVLDDNDVEAKKNAINEFLGKYGEQISNDIFGITFIKVHAKEYLYEKMGQKFCDPSFGLAELVQTCYKKGEKSYKIAIKNSLVQIAKNSFYGQ
jgi:GTPase SAR1 family protein